MVKAVVGANWGDEGKGKITDMLAEKADIIIRFQGGANAGHTIINDYGKFALHTLPSGVFYGHTTSIIGNGVAVGIPVLFKEIQSIIDRDVPMPKILVSDRAQMVMSYHKNFDAYEEERLGGKSFGSTKSGIAPFYSDKYAKIGFQISELFEDEAELREKVNRVAEQKNVMLEHLYHKPLINPDDLYNELMEYKEMVAPYVCNVSLYLDEALKEGKEILLEGQLGTLKDPDHGIYPMVTSSSTLAAYGAIGAGIPPSSPLAPADRKHHHQLGSTGKAAGHHPQGGLCRRGRGDRRGPFLHGGPCFFRGQAHHGAEYFRPHQPSAGPGQRATAFQPAAGQRPDRSPFGLRFSA